MVALMTVLFAFSFDILKYSEMSCIDAQTLIDRVYEYNQQSEFITTKDADEIVEVIKESVPSVLMKDQNQIPDGESKQDKWNRGLDIFIESVIKPDPSLRQCAHNQRCYHELMDVRQDVLNYLKTKRWGIDKTY